MNVVKNLLLLLVSLIFVLILGEFTVRIALGGITSTANMQTWFGKRWQRDYVTLNGLGYREREFEQEKPPGVYRIAVVGDSFAYGQGLPVEERFSNLLEAELNGRGDRVYEVLNFAVPGLTTAMELEVLREHVWPAQPDFVLVQWLPNDFVDQLDVPRPRRSTLAPTHEMHRWLHVHSALYFLLNNQWVNFKTALGTEKFDYADNLMIPFRESGSDLRDAALAPMVEMLGELERSGTDFAVLLHPLLRPELTGDYPLAPMHAAVSALCVRMDANCVELTPVFAALGPDYDLSKLWVNRFDQHPSAHANRMVAEFAMGQFAENIWAVTEVGREGVND